MKKLHLDLKNVGEVPEAYRYSAEELSKLSGANLGNFVFRHALRSFVRDFTEYEQIDNSELSRLSGKTGVDSIIVSCANWLGTREHDEKANKRRADLYSRVDGPVIAFGLGVQAPHGADKVELGPESQRLAKVLSKKCEALSVRDQITHDTLHSIGIDNAIITGCPSNFINLQPGLGARIARKARGLVDRNISWKRMRTCISEVSAIHAKGGEIFASISQILQDCPSFYVVQSPMLLPMMLGESREIPKAYRGVDGIHQKDVIDVLKRAALHFSSVESWLDFSRTCDFALGMRIHGNMVPIQAGVPALLLGHDSRTTGLGEKMGIPMVTPDFYLESIEAGVAPLLRYVADVMDEYDDLRARVASDMLYFMRANGLRPTEEFEELAT